MELEVVQGDSLEFEVKIKIKTTSGVSASYELQEGEKFFFMIAEPCAAGECNEKYIQEESLFRIPEINLKPGNYEFDFGYIRTDGTIKTLIDRNVGKLIVKRRTGERK